ncbi:metallophosphoesterase [Tenacibaculum sp. 190524A02b]|uniref:metallophosphoesterase n=1 Tax=Tenacibaculum vairaonense TaxID=3137860 RepID=UPI0031FA91FD
MKVQVCSDLHLEFKENREWLQKNPIIPKGEILIIAGDFYHLDKNFAALDFINKVSEEFEAIYIVPGNHEYYGGYDISTALGSTCKKVKNNVFIVNNYQTEIKGTKFIFSTMWSKIEKNIYEITQAVTDFRKIKFKNEQFNAIHFNKIHEASFNFIKKAVQSEGKKVVVTHHLPSYDCMNEAFKKSMFKTAFCVEKKEFIKDSNIDFWIYGHSHRNLGDLKIGNTQMISNQFGYVNWKEHETFDYERIIEI